MAYYCKAYYVRNDNILYHNKDLAKPKRGVPGLGTSPQAIPLAIITMRKSIHEFSFLFIGSVVLYFTWQAYGPPELR